MDQAYEYVDEQMVRRVIEGMPDKIEKTSGVMIEVVERDNPSSERIP